jgi:hypothetical protein
MAARNSPPDAGKEAALFCKKARKKRLLIWALGFDALTAHGPDYQKFFGSLRPDDRASARSESGRTKEIKKELLP